MKLQPDEKHEAIKMTRPRIIKNVVVLSSGVLVLFTAYDGLTMLQSTMNGNQGLGVASQAILYFCFCISALVFPKYVIKRLGSKLTVILSMASYVPYVASNFYPEWSVMIPTSMLLGFGGALLWGSQANYLNDVSMMYADLLLSEKRGETESGLAAENESEGDNESKRENFNAGDIPTEKTKNRINLEIGTRNETKTDSELGGIKSGMNTETKSSRDGKRRKISNAGCRCISCVYIEYDQTDTYLLENQLKTEKRNKSSHECVPVNFEVLASEQPLSSSECHLSNKDKSRNHHNVKVFNQNCINKNGFENQNEKIKDQSIVVNTLNGESIPDSNFHVPNNIADSYEQYENEKNTKKDEPENCNFAIDRNNPILSKKISPPFLKVFTSNDQTTESNDTYSIKNSEMIDKQNNFTELNKEVKANFDSSSTNEKEIVKANQKIPPQGNNSNERKRLVEATTARFFGIHGLFFLSSSIWSNLMSYGVLHSGEQQTATFASTNATCGVGFCGFESREHQQRHQPSDETRYALTGVCVALGVASVALVATFLDSLEDKNKNERFTLGLLTATLALVKRGKLLMLMPLSFYLGLSKGFYTADFTKAFVGCALGTTHVGLVTVCYGAACAVSSVTSGLLVRRCGRAPIFAVAAAANVSACALMLAWTPTGAADSQSVLFGLAALWGCHAGIVWSQIRAFYGVLYKADEEAAFATFHTWYSLGFSLSFAYSEFLCTYVKICVLLVISAIGYVGYFIVESKHSRKMNK